MLSISLIFEKIKQIGNQFILNCLYDHVKNEYLEDNVVSHTKKDMQGRNLLYWCIVFRQSIQSISSAVGPAHLNLFFSCFDERPDKPQPLIIAAEEGLTSLVDFFINIEPRLLNRQSRCGQTALMSAAQKGHVLTVESLLQRAQIDLTATSKKMRTLGTDITSNLGRARKFITNTNFFNGNTALHWAAFAGHEPIVRLLITKANEQRSPILNQKNKLSISAFFMAILFGHISIIQYLLEQPELLIEPTALLYAIEHNLHEIIKALIKKRVTTHDFTNANKIQQPITNAAGVGNIELINTIIELNETRKLANSTGYCNALFIIDSLLTLAPHLQNKVL